MSLPLQTLKKVGILLGTSLFPLIIFLLLILFRINIFTAATASIFIALLLTIISHKFTDSPFLRMFEGKTFGVITFDSRGKIEFFDVALEGDNFKGNFMGWPIEIPFNANFFWRISDVFKKGTLKEEEKQLVLKLEKTEFNKSLFKTDFPILVWDKQLKMFITKDWLHKQEKKDMWFSKAFELKKEIIEYNKSASAITKVIVDMIGAKIRQSSWIIWLILILVVGYLLWQFWPTINGIFSGAINSATTTAGGAIAQALPEKLA